MGRRTTGLLVLVLFSGGLATAQAAPRGEHGAVVSSSMDAACDGLPSDVRSAPLFGAGSVLGHQKLVRRETKQMLTRSKGARVIVRAEPGMTAPYLERVALCQVAQYRSGAAHDDGHPLAAGDLTVHVVPVTGAFALHLTAKEPKVAREIASRVERLSRR